MPKQQQSITTNQDLLKKIFDADILVAKKGSPVRSSELVYDSQLSETLQASIYLADDTNQETGSFKIRGAYLAMYHLDSEEREKGVVTTSAGNFGAGVAQSCNIFKVHGDVWVPVGTPKNKINNIKTFGGKFIDVHEAGSNFAMSEKIAKVFCQERQATYLSPFDSLDVIAGQGTWGSEILKALPKDEAIDYLICPVGGGGLITGVGTVVKAKYPNAKIIAVEPIGAASLSHARQHGRPTFIKGQIDTFVDGAAVSKIGKLVYEYGNSLIDEVVLVPNIETRKATTYLWEREDQSKRVELASGMTLAGLIKLGPLVKNKTVVILISGLNLSEERYTKEVQITNRQRLRKYR